MRMLGTLELMEAAEKAARSSRSDREAMRKFQRDITRRRHTPLGSITWGTRARTLGTVLDMRPPIITPMDSISIVMGPIPQEPPPPIPFRGNPDTQPGAWPGLTFTNPTITTPTNEPPPIVVSGSPGQVPVVVTPTSGPIPSPGTVAAGTTPPTSWLDQSLFAGIPNKYLLLGGVGAFIFFGGKKK